MGHDFKQARLNRIVFVVLAILGIQLSAFGQRNNLDNYAYGQTELAHSEDGSTIRRHETIGKAIATPLTGAAVGGILGLAGFAIANTALPPDDGTLVSSLSRYFTVWSWGIGVGIGGYAFGCPLGTAIGEGFAGTWQRPYILTMVGSIVGMAPLGIMALPYGGRQSEERLIAGVAISAFTAPIGSIAGRSLGKAMREKRALRKNDASTHSHPVITPGIPQMRIGTKGDISCGLNISMLF